MGIKYSRILGISLYDHWTLHEALANVELLMGRHRRRRASIHTALRQGL